jgi:flagellar hook-length control protein FliK
VTSPTERSSAQHAATSSKPAEDLASDRPIASEAEPGAKAAFVPVPVNATEKPAGEKTLNETMALMEKANADLPQAAQSVRPLKQTRSEHVRAAETASVHANAPQAVSAAATEPSIGQPRDAVRTQATTEPHATASTAARFARALERAGAVATSESAAGAQAGTNANSGSEQQSTLGEGSRERAMQPFAAPRHAIGGVSFTAAAPTAIDVRTLARAVDAASHAVETTAATIPERDIVAQLVQSMRVQFRDGIGEAVVRLKPEHLGSVEISLKVENGAIKATVHAEVAAVRQWLESQQETLRTSLAEQGLRLERFVVEADGKRHTGSDDAQPREQRRRQPRQRMSGKDHPVFEVTV